MSDIEDNEHSLIINQQPNKKLKQNLLWKFIQKENWIRNNRAKTVKCNFCDRLNFILN